MIIKKVKIILLIFLLFPNFVFAKSIKQSGQNFQENIFKAEVLQVLNQKNIVRKDGSRSIVQKLRVKGLQGKWKDKEIVFNYIEEDAIVRDLYKKGNKVLVSCSQDVNGNYKFYIIGFIRTDSIFLLTLIFVLTIALTGRWRGIRAILGLIFSFFVILKLIIPQILQGSDPLSITLAYSFLIIIVSTYLVYGLDKKSTISIIGTFFGIFIVGILSVIFTDLTRLVGFAQEETIYLMNIMGQKLNMQGLLLSGFIIGAIGILSDITVSQVSTVKEINGANLNLSKKSLFGKAMKVGVDHISSMVNTLFLAYAGVSFPLLMLFSVKQAPFLTFSQVINNEIIATEIVRTLVGSIGLALAVPITTFLAVYFYKKQKD